jgi:hypothetical protein
MVRHGSKLCRLTRDSKCPNCKKPHEKKNRPITLFISIPRVASSSSQSGVADTPSTFEAQSVRLRQAEQTIRKRFRAVNRIVVLCTVRLSSTFGCVVSAGECKASVEIHKQRYEQAALDASRLEGELHDCKQKHTVEQQQAQLRSQSMPLSSAALCPTAVDVNSSMHSRCAS